METTLKLYTSVNGNIDVPFPNSENQIEIGDFKYEAKRMGGAPTITANVWYPTCLDDFWSDSVYTEFNGERYFIKQTPTSSLSNEEYGYSHEVEFVSERVILDNVYFYDVVSSNEDDKPVSNSTKVVFFGDIHEFAERLQASLNKSNIDYTVIVDSGVTSEEKLISFEDQFFSNVLQEIYSTYDIPYYFEGKNIHIGFDGSVLPDVLSYGVDDALLSIKKNNSNYKIVNRATARGSSENIPFYYPNNSPKGDIAADSALDVNVVNYEKFSNEVDIDGEIVFTKKTLEKTTTNTRTFTGIGNTGQRTIYFSDVLDIEMSGIYYVQFGISSHIAGAAFEIPIVGITFNRDGNVEQSITVSPNVKTPIDLKKGYYTFSVSVRIPSVTFYDSETITIYSQCDFSGTVSAWIYNGEKINLIDVGLEVDGDAEEGDVIKQVLVRYVNTSEHLMPPIYRETFGEDRFYNALNGVYTGEDDSPILFNNPYTIGNPKEHIFDVSDIKPTIKEAVYNDIRIDKFADVKFDLNDNNETYDDEEGGTTNFKHPLFFVKLAPLGFNLFEHAIEQNPMTIEMTSGSCGACKFKIAVDYDDNGVPINTVQVDESGNLVYDDDGYVLCGSEATSQGEIEPQEIQQDTTNRPVWIALYKEEETYGQLMPYAPKIEYGETLESGHRPKYNDTFVITGIKLPQTYITNAEERVKYEIIKYLKDNNDEKFTFSISFSRIYFAENKDILNVLNENSRITILYNGTQYRLYVTSFTYDVSSDEALPSISVELDEELSISENSIQKSINEVKSEVGKALANADVVGACTPYFIRKDVANEVIVQHNFKKGIKFGEGGRVDVLDNNSAKLTIEYLEVTKKATFTSLEIQERVHVGGQLLITPASMNCGEVEEFDDYYRCYFQTKGETGDEIFNQFVVGDQAICQTFNTLGSRYYWRLVTGVGEDYIDLSRTDYDEYSQEPMEGDKIIQLGNRTDVKRQNAIVLASHGDETPHFIQYQGINDYSLSEDKVVTKFSPYGNLITGVLNIQAGSGGLEFLKEWEGKQQQIDTAGRTADEALAKAEQVKQEYQAELNAYKQEVSNNLEEIQGQIDGSITSWFYAPVPTLDNLPASEWTTDEDKNIHLGDLYYSSEGKAYRFQLVDGVYSWSVITDTDITKALANAKKAQDTADSKRRIFASQPVPPYDEGDLWVNATYGKYVDEILRCKTPKTIGETFAISNWELASKYTDDTVAYDAEFKARILSAAASGEMIYKDAEFKEGTNGVKRYDNAFTGLVTIERVEMSDAPNTSGYVIKVHSHYGDGVSPGKGGWHFSMQGRYNSEYICRFVAKLPVGESIDSFSNVIGDGGTRKWISSQNGTGDWEEYIYYVKYGGSGAYSSTFFFALSRNGSTDVDWYLSYATVFQLNTSTTLITDLAELNNTVSELEGALDVLDEYIDNAFKDGVIDEAEKNTILGYINVVNESFADLQSSYIGLYNNEYLSGEPKSNLESAFNALYTSKDNLINTINNTTAEDYVSLVDGAYAVFIEKVTDFKSAYEAANKYIQDVLKKYSDDAQDSADEANNKIDNLEVGGNNLLRNTGFTGDYLSVQLNENKNLNEDYETFSPQLEHWEYTNSVSVISLEEISSSGYGVSFPMIETTLSQGIYYKIFTNESYVVSFKARSYLGTSIIKITVGGGQEKQVEVDSEWSKYIIKPTVGNNNIFSISGQSIEICEIKLEKGNKETPWSPSIIDNTSELAYWQSTQDLLGAVKGASTTVNGGLTLTNVLMVGNYNDESKGMTEVTGGVSGIYNDENDVAFWGGGTFEEAIYSSMLLSENPSYQPTDSDLSKMAKYVVTHGGRVILNDVVARGRVYATGGQFTGEVYATSGKFENVEAYGSFRSPFVNAQPESVDNLFDEQNSDNIYVDTNTTTGAISNTFILPWRNTSIGRKITITCIGRAFFPIGEYDYQDDETISWVPSFIENGIRSDVLTANNEILELIGWGDTYFKGWIVVNRKPLISTLNLGRPLPVTIVGRIGWDGTSKTHRVWYKSTNGEYVTSERIERGKYVVSFPSFWFDSLDDIVCMATIHKPQTPELNNVENVSILSACVWVESKVLDSDSGRIKITFFLSADVGYYSYNSDYGDYRDYNKSTFKIDGDFEFMVYNMNQW